MINVANYFELDFPHTAAKRYELEIGVQDGSGRMCKIVANAHIDFTAHVLFSSFYLSPVEGGMGILDMCKAALASRPYIFDLKGGGNFRLPALESMAGSDIQVKLNDPLLEVSLLPLEGGEFNVRDFELAPATYIYGELTLSEAEAAALAEIGRENKTVIRYRGPPYAAERAKLAGPKAFISYDSRDSDIAREIALGLFRMGHPVWFAEFALRPGDRLRQTIEKGIKECKRCILVLTPNFLSNGGWAATEFDSIFAREIQERKSLVIPVWAGVSEQQVFEYSPSLKNVLGAQWNPRDAEDSVRKIANGLNLESVSG
jgi:TIR domain-containing protein